MKKLNRHNLEELAKVMPVLSEIEQRTFIGGSGNGYVYTYDEFQYMLLSGNWNGGEVAGYGYINPDGTPNGNVTTGAGWFGSHYIGPTSDEVLAAMPTPVHAADYIAMLHDLEYKNLGLNGFSGTLSPESRGADERLIQRCNELISLYKNGITTYNGYTITEQAYNAAKHMRLYFTIEQGITGFSQ